jgi:hypothetical protein
MSSSPYPDELNDRVHFKLAAAKTHLDRLKQLKASEENFVSSSTIRMQAEMEADEFFYHLVCAKEALLQEINSKLNLGLLEKHVKLETINEKLNELNKRKPGARELTKEICNMMSDDHDPLWLINELHNWSKHRSIIYPGLGYEIIADAERGIISTSLIDPRTGKGMRTDEEKQKSIIQYPEESYTNIEKLQKTVRNKISRYGV